MEMKNKTRQLLARSLKTFRTIFRMSQAETAELFKVSKKAYASYEEGRAEPSLETLIQATKVYGLKSIDDLVFGNTTRPAGAKEVFFEAYRKSTPDKRRIVDFILKGNEILNAK